MAGPNVRKLRQFQMEDIKLFVWKLLHEDENISNQADTDNQHVPFRWLQIPYTSKRSIFVL